MGVDGFFAISGFLITASWLSNPRLREYLSARALRIFPGFYVCLVVTAFVIAPVGVAMQGGSAAKLITSGAPLEFVLENSAVALVKFDIGGTPRGIPDAGVWNGSLWSLIWELMCYLAVALIGVIGLANRRWISPAMFALALAGTMLLPPLTQPEVAAVHQKGSALLPLMFLAARTAIMFSAGAFLYQWRDRIPARWSLVAVSIAIVAASSLLPDYRAVAAIPLAYAVVVSGALVRHKRLRLRTDLSYGVYIYACPMQQLLAISGLIWLNPLAFAALSTMATLPLAALSWFLVEKPAQSFKRRLKRKGSAHAAAEGENRPAAVDVVEPPPAEVPGAGQPNALPIKAISAHAASAPKRSAAHTYPQKPEALFDSGVIRLRRQRASNDGSSQMKLGQVLDP
ncbi:acyltransferase [Mycobacterium sp. 852002-40037_SCH5390672]|nr:acyltransferase [Mycobacterium sp. 852002-40037_SCH5390672]